MFFSRTETAQLTIDQWDALCIEHQMPFVAIPPDTEYATVGGWAIMTADGLSAIVKPPDVTRLYGQVLLPLDALPTSIQEEVRDRFNDPMLLYKCRADQGFLVNRLVLKALRGAMVDHGISSQDIGTIKSIEVSLRISYDSKGHATIDAIPMSLEKK